MTRGPRGFFTAQVLTVASSVALMGLTNMISSETASQDALKEAEAAAQEAFIANLRTQLEQQAIDVVQEVATGDPSAEPTPATKPQVSAARPAAASAPAPAPDPAPVAAPAPAPEPAPAPAPAPAPDATSGGS